MNLLYAVEDEREIKENQRLKKVAISTEVKFKKYRVDNNIYLLLRLLKSSAEFDNRLDPSIDKLASLFGEIKEVANYSKYFEIRIVIKEHQEELFIHKNMKVDKPLNEHKLKVNKFITVDLTRSPGVLIAASSGSGKSYYLMYLLVQMLKETNNIYVIDGKFKEIKKAALQMGIDTVANDVEESIQFIEKIEKLIDHRNSQDVKDPDTVFIVIDEYTFFLDKILSEYGPKKVKEIENKIINIVLTGRSANIVIVLVLQRLGAAKSKEEVGLHLRIRDNIATKIGLGDLSPENFEMLFGQRKDDKIITKKTQEGYLKIGGMNGLQAFRVDNIKFDDDFQI